MFSYYSDVCTCVLYLDTMSVSVINSADIILVCFQCDRPIARLPRSDTSTWEPFGPSPMVCGEGLLSYRKCIVCLPLDLCYNRYFPTTLVDLELVREIR